MAHHGGNDRNAFSRRQVLAGATTLALAAPGVARAAWPADRPIEVIVPYPPGGGVDTMDRVVLPFLQQHLPGARFVVVNRAGAGGQLGWEALMMAAPDGYTLAASSVPALVTYPIERTTRYQAAALTYLANVVDDPGGLFVAANSPLKSLQDLLAAARARPGTISYGTTGVGSDDHLLVIGLEEAARLRPMNHAPFNGMAPLSTALLGGHLELGAFNMSESLALLRDGRIRCLGQAAATRWATTPEVPTFREQGLDLISGATRGLLAPPNLPAELRTALEAACRAALADPAFVREAERMGLPLAPQIGDEYRATVLKSEQELRALWGRRPWRDG
jgi:tripartite-type tricarboxylate transporter receptor subunit TctC